MARLDVRSGGGANVEFRGLKEFRRELRKADDPGFPRALSRVHKIIATKGATWARNYALAMGGIQAKAAGAIRGYATQVSVQIGFTSGSARFPFAGPAFFGQKRHFGWYASSRYNDSLTPQGPPWIGNTWDVAVRNQGPYAINPASADHLTDIEDEYAGMVDQLVRVAFPDRG